MIQHEGFPIWDTTHEKLYTSNIFITIATSVVLALLISMDLLVTMAEMSATCTVRCQDITKKVVQFILLPCCTQVAPFLDQIILTSIHDTLPVCPRCIWKTLPRFCYSTMKPTANRFNYKQGFQNLVSSLVFLLDELLVFHCALVLM